MADKEFDFTIVDELGVLSTSPKGWTKELNLISWNGREPKYDMEKAQSYNLFVIFGARRTAVHYQ